LSTAAGALRATGRAGSPAAAAPPASGAGRSRGLARPWPVTVRTGSSGMPLALEGRTVEAVREEWLVEDRWWTGRPLKRRYFELVLEDGVNAVVFHDLASRRWFGQRGA
jgi:hypothetical protein